MQKTWSEVIQELLLKEILLEDPSTGIIQIHPQYYKELGKPFPGATAAILHSKRAGELTIKYLEIWPKKILSGGRPVRQGPSGVVKKLAQFIKNNRFTDEQILDATLRYVKTKEQENWQYMVCADYFIYKDGTSLLEAYALDTELGKPALKKVPQVQLNQKFL